MATYANAFGPHAPDDTYVAHDFEEQLVDVGEVEINYATAGDASRPALLLIPGQTESWWGYEPVLPLLAEHFQAFAVDLRGQGRSSRTPGRYTLDLIGNDLVRFIDTVIGRPTIVAGLSSGGVLSAWLSAFAKPGQVVGAYYEDPPIFSSDVRPAVGQSIRQAIGPIFTVMAKYLGDQWSIGDWDGLIASLPTELPGWMAMLAGAFGMQESGPPQMLKEYDPEWGRAFGAGTFYGPSGDHERMLRSVKVPVLFTHHFRAIDEATGALMGASSDLQAARTRQLVTEAGQPFEYVSLPTAPHGLHGSDPRLYVDTLVGWADTLPNGAAS
jgi:pimeloyl-ACP methyl ester carboxylesterase